MAGPRRERSNDAIVSLGDVPPREEADCGERVVSDLPPTNGAAFYIVAQPDGCAVQVTWSDGVEGPDILFATKADAMAWISLDAPGWFARLSTLQDPPAKA